MGYIESPSAAPLYSFCELSITPLALPLDPERVCGTVGAPEEGAPRLAPDITMQPTPPAFVLSQQKKRKMRLKTIVLATAFAATSSLAFAQPAPIGSSADFGNGAVINRGPVRTTGEDMDFRTDRSSLPRPVRRRQTHSVKHGHTQHRALAY